MRVNCVGDSIEREIFAGADRSLASSAKVYSAPVSAAFSQRVARVAPCAARAASVVRRTVACSAAIALASTLAAPAGGAVGASIVESTTLSRSETRRARSSSSATAKQPRNARPKACAPAWSASIWVLVKSRRAGGMSVGFVTRSTALVDLSVGMARRSVALKPATASPPVGMGTYSSTDGGGRWAVRSATG